MTDCPHCDGPLSPAERREERRTVAVLICWACGWDTPPMYARRSIDLAYERMQNLGALRRWWKWPPHANRRPSGPIGRFERLRTHSVQEKAS